MTDDALTRQFIQLIENAARADGDPVPHLAGLVDLLRPPRRRPEMAEPRYRALNALMESRPDLRAILSGLVLDLFAGHDALPFYTEAGILSDRGFGAELRRRVGTKLLPDLPDDQDLIHALRRIYRHTRDVPWLARVSRTTQRNFWGLLLDDALDGDQRLARIHARQAEAARLLACRCAAWGEHPEARRLRPRAPCEDSPFLELSGTLGRWLREHGDIAPVFQVLERCQDEVRDIRARAAGHGTSLALTLLLLRLGQSLERLTLLVGLLDEANGHDRPDLPEAWTRFFSAALGATLRRDSLRDYLRQATGLLSLRVTENAGHAGEHYIASGPGELSAMARSALGGGAIIGVLALFKVMLHHEELAPAIQALAYGLNYGLGFVLIHLLGFTVATKQPAMTAATLAAAVEEAHRGGWHPQRLWAMFASVGRTQSVAILGNVGLALPVALLVGWYLGVGPEASSVTRADAEHMLRDLHPLASPAIAHAAVAGVCLFLAGLISGYFDNVARYERIGERVANLAWLRLLTGKRGAAWLGGATDRHLGAIMGNLLFGLMLGSAGFIGFIFGLPLDIRHVAFASANLGYALAAFDFRPEWLAFAWAALGVVLIALTNLAVSFVLALGVALRARGLGLREMLRALRS
jgi:site-specific recombinase